MSGGRVDVLIVGAGPSGSFLGYLLARKGYSVRIIDKATFPRDKVCGGGISNKTIELLPFDIGPVIQRRITGAFLTYRNGDTVVKDLGARGGAAVVRSEFDLFLLEHAMEAGAQFQGNTEFISGRAVHGSVTATTARGNFNARYLVGADGVNSRVRRLFFGHDLVTYAPAVEALVSVPAESAAQLGDRALFDFGAMPRGYGWIFPKKDHLNAGVFSIYPSQEIRRHLARFMSCYEILRAPRHVKYLGFAIPLSNVRKEYGRGNVLLAGDAGGFVESFYGEGIYFALLSARVAASAIEATFGRPAGHAYNHLVAKHLQPDLTYSGLNARMFFPRQRFGFYRMARNAHVNDYFAELIAGRVGHRECFYKTILTSPRWLLSRHVAPLARQRF